MSKMSGIDQSGGCDGGSGDERAAMAAADEAPGSVAAAAAIAMPPVIVEGQELTEEVILAHGHEHQHLLHDQAISAAAEERSVMRLASTSTSFDRLDDEGTSRLQRGGDGGGVFDSMGTMSKMSGIDPSGVFRAASAEGEGGGGSSDMPTVANIPAASTGSADSGGSCGGGAMKSAHAVQKPKLLSRKVSFGAASESSATSGGGKLAIESYAKPKPVRRGVSWGSGSDDGMTQGQGQGESERGGPLRPGHRKQGSASFLLMIESMASSVRSLVQSGVTPSTDSEEDSPKKRAGLITRTESPWSLVNRRLDSIMIRKNKAKSDFDFAEVQLDKDDVANLEAAGVPIAPDGTVMASSVELERRGMWSALDSIKRKFKKEKLLEKTSEIRSSFDVSVKECVVAIVAYLVISVLAFSVIFERWPVVDSLYFAVVTFTTIGYGDLTPSTLPGQIFMCFFGLGGVASLGLALGVIGGNIIDAELNTIRTARDESQREVLHLFKKDEDQFSDEQESEKTGLLRVPVEGKEKAHSITERCCGCFVPILSSSFVREVLPLLAILLTGSILVALREGWGASTGVYYAVVTTCTIGYGDFAPTLPLTRLFSVFFIPVAVGIMGQFLGAFSTYVINERQKKFRKALDSVELGVEHLEGMSSSGDGVVSRLDYVEFMLLAMGKVDKEELEELHNQFDDLDLTGDGALTEEDLKIFARKKLHSTRKKLELAEYKACLLKSAETPDHASIKQRASILAAVESKL